MKEEYAIVLGGTHHGRRFSTKNGTTINVKKRAPIPRNLANYNLYREEVEQTTFQTETYRLMRFGNGLWNWDAPGFIEVWVPIEMKNEEASKLVIKHFGWDRTNE